MRSLEQHQAIMRLWEQEQNQCEISRQLKIPRSTVRDSIIRYQEREIKAYYSQTEVESLLHTLKNPSTENASVLRPAYAYLLGIYLGDGCVNKARRVYRLRVSLDARYPGIIQECKTAIETLLPLNKVGEVRNYYQDRLSHIDVSSFYKDWPTLLPQHGEKHKHERPIVLMDWQKEIVDLYALEFFRGLFHSDGSRFPNIVKGKDYPRYQFSNCSRDIIDLFIAACKRLNIHYTEKFFEKPGHALRYDVFISKRKDVTYLDSVIGPKA
jgi:hypothetical protein